MTQLQPSSSGVRAVIADNLQAFMFRSNKSRNDVCSDLGIKYTTFCEWIRGTASPRLESLELLSDYFNVEITDFFRSDNSAGSRDHLWAYASAAKALNIDIISHLTDTEIKELLKSGFTFRHRSLDDYISASAGKSVATEEVDWGTPTGAELW